MGMKQWYRYMSRIDMICCVVDIGKWGVQEGKEAGVLLSSPLRWLGRWHRFEGKMKWWAHFVLAELETLWAIHADDLINIWEFFQDV